MWPFKKRRQTPYADDLRSSELKWLDEQRAALGKLGQLAGVAPGTDLLRTADAVIVYWHSQPESARPDPNEVVNAAGVALGDALAKAHGLEWKIVTDAYGTDMGLWWNDGDGKVLSLAPTHSVAKRFADGRSGYVVELFGQLSAAAAQMRGGAAGS